MSKNEKDPLVEKMIYYHNHQAEIEHQKRVDEYLKNQEELGKALQNHLYSGKILKENGIQIFDLHQANEDFRKVMKLYDIKEIAGVYSDKNEQNKSQREKVVSITKSNFYNAFYLPIWKNLTVPERIKSLEWMFETINESYNLGIKSISYFVEVPFPLNVDDLALLDGSYIYSEDETKDKSKILFFNLDKIEDPLCVYELVATLAHELTHAKQKKLADKLDLTRKNSFYEVSQAAMADFDDVDLTLSFHTDDAQTYALYRVCLSEKVAELQSLKTVKKYIEQNEKKFGKNKRTTELFGQMKNEMLFEKADFRYVNGKKHFDVISGIVTNENEILKGQSENLLKLIILKNFYRDEKFAFENAKNETNNAISMLRDDFENDKISRDECFSQFDKLSQELEYQENCIKEDENKIENIKATFIKTLADGKLPEEFDQKEFDVLNILDEPKSEFSLPKWLRKDEMKHKKENEVSKDESV